MLCAQNILAHGASGLVLGPVLAPRTLVRVQPLAMVERDDQGYIKEEALGDWTELKKSAAELTHARPGASVGYVQAARTRLPRWVRTGRAGRPAPRAPRTVRTGYAYQPRAYRTYRVPWHPRSTALGATVTEWRDLPKGAQGIVTAVRESPDTVKFDDVISWLGLAKSKPKPKPNPNQVEFDDVISALDAGYDATEVRVG